MSALVDAVKAWAEGRSEFIGGDYDSDADEAFKAAEETLLAALSAADAELCDFVPTPEMRGEPKPVACPRCGAEFSDDGPITYSGCLECEPEAARAAGARPAGGDGG